MIEPIVVQYLEAEAAFCFHAEFARNLQAKRPEIARLPGVEHAAEPFGMDITAAADGSAATTSLMSDSYASGRTRSWYRRPSENANVFKCCIMLAEFHWNASHMNGLEPASMSAPQIPSDP